MVSRRPGRFDALLVLALGAIVVLEAVVTDTARSPVVHAGVSLVAVAALAWRRVAPILVLCVVLASVFIVDPQDQFAIFAALAIASYSVGAHVEGPATYVGPALAIGAPWLAFLTDAGSQPSDFVAPVVLYGGAWGVGRLARGRTHQAETMRERLVLLESEAEAREREAVVDERARIARELHDIVAHAISVIAIQSQAVRRRLPRELTREADDLLGIEKTAREAMVEMRRLFGVLRTDDSPTSLQPQPGLDQLDRLAAQLRTAGLPLDVETNGTPVTLGPGVDLAAYRVIQEALTNAVRHAGSAPTRVVLSYGESELDVTVEDQGHARAYGGGGHGLIGMRERVALYGGTLEAGPADGGKGFRVHARLPFREST